jgi:uncharacterized protein (DUF302 family)
VVPSGDITISSYKNILEANMEQTRYGLRRVVEMPYEAALERVRETLGSEGFGILTEIDIREKLKEKLDIDYRRYIILGACNPPLAHRALEAEADIGLLLPCNVIVYDLDGEQSVVAALDPAGMVEMTGNSGLREIASEARGRLERAINAV